MSDPTESFRVFYQIFWSDVDHPSRWPVAHGEWHKTYEEALAVAETPVRQSIGDTKGAIWPYTIVEARVLRRRTEVEFRDLPKKGSQDDKDQS